MKNFAQQMAELQASKKLGTSPLHELTQTQSVMKRVMDYVNSGGKDNDVIVYNLTSDTIDELRKHGFKVKLKGSNREADVYSVRWS